MERENFALAVLDEERFEMRENGENFKLDEYTVGLNAHIWEGDLWEGRARGYGIAPSQEASLFSPSFSLPMKHIWVKEHDELWSRKAVLVRLNQTRNGKINVVDRAKEEEFFSLSLREKSRLRSEKLRKAKEGMKPLLLLSLISSVRRRKDCCWKWPQDQTSSF